MRPRNQGQSIRVIELLGNVLSKRVAGPSGTDPPPAPVIRIGPQQIAHRSLMRDLLDPIQLPDLVQTVQTGRKTSMKTENLVFDHGGQREQVEEVREVLPNVGISVFPQAFIIESIDLGDLSGLVVASEDGDSVLEPDLVADQQGHCLHRVVPSVHVIPHKQVVRIWGSPS